MSRPYVLEIYPDRGYASLAICTFDMLGGVIDGINSEGLVVAILAEEESIQKFGLEPGNEVGLYELQSMRYLLDNCKDVTEAKEALLSLKHYYSFIPCHYIIADRSGRSFIFEFSPHRNRCLTTDGKGPQCVTNHLVALHPSEADLPAGDSFNRFKTLRVATKIKEKFTLAEIREINARVAIPPLASNNPEYAPGRTIWYALYDTEERSLSIRFYLGEKPDPADPKGVILNYSQLKEFRLKK
jgi:predicted choloylglycine hydrolase